MNTSNENFAVLIDADNISHTKIKAILDEIANMGVAVIKRVYGDFAQPNLAPWKDVALQFSITSVQQYAYTKNKNATDTALIIDAMDILHNKPFISGFCILSSDSDYTRLAIRLKESGKRVYGFGEKKTPNPFIRSCDKFIYVENLDSAAATPAINPKDSTHVNDDMKTSSSTQIASQQYPPVDNELKNLIISTINSSSNEDGWALLSKVGYIVTKKKTDFDPRNYGFQKLMPLIKSMGDLFEILEKTATNNLKIIYVRNKTKK